MGRSLYGAAPSRTQSNGKQDALARSSQSRGLDKTAGKFGSHEPQALLSPEETAYRAAIHDKRKTRTQSLILKFLLAIIFVCLPHPVAAMKDCEHCLLRAVPRRETVYTANRARCMQCTEDQKGYCKHTGCPRH